jgi:homoserine O-succinyltransferase
MVLTHPAAPGARSPAGRRPGGRRPRWTCALVNNMPDSAFQETERQFLSLLDASTGSETIDIRLIVMDGVPRGPRVADQIRRRYGPLADLYLDPPDVLVVTGANPVEEHLSAEPFWDDLAALLAWAGTNVQSMMASCLAAHAALAVFDGIHRTALPEKRTGLFPQRTEPGQPLTDGLPPSFVLPHSRWNAVPTGQLRAAGYDVPVRSEDGDWSVATRTMDRCQLVLVQAHPEYGPTSLLREYHRDARRYVAGTQDDAPALPRDCTGPEDRRQLAELHRRITGGERDPALVAGFPFDAVGARAPRPWAAPATLLYANWLAGVPARAS